jgi:hypothetical protein
MKYHRSDSSFVSVFGLIARAVIAIFLSARIFAQQEQSDPIGSALVDDRNPIARLFSGERIDLWSLKPILDSARESVVASKHPVDGFLKRAGQELPKANLLQRLSLDLIGLRASYQEVTVFLDDQSPDAMEKQLDRLLGDPRFGEHWARLWLDAVRYSDSNGFDWDEYRQGAWRYRDFVVRAFNDDLPYDQFVLWQLAGDELLDGPPQSQQQLDQLIATGYLRLGPYDNAAKLFNEQDRARSEVLTDLTETTGAAFLGLTFSCCRCHHHKTDPLSQQDHYRFRAFFAAIEFDDSTPIELHQQQSIQDPNQAPKTGLLTSDNPTKIDTICVLDQGDHKKPLDPVEPGFPSVLFPNPPQIVAPGHGRTTGRRLALAQWIVSRENPWTARVIVNRIWQNLFGDGLVATANDLGVTGASPISRELLDHLATYLVEHHWSIKSLIRYIVLSEAYQAQIGPTRKLRRLTAEQMRDVVLQVTGQLQHRNGGPPVWPPVSEDVLQANPATLDDNETKTKGWYPSAASQQTVRSIYLIQKRTVRIPWMETFDLPENTVSCARRDVSIVAAQALALLNADWVWDVTQQFAQQQIRSVDQAFEAILSRKPSQRERSICQAYLDSGRSLQELALVLVNSNELGFVP